MSERAIWLRAEDGCAVVCVEHAGRWIEIIREPLSSPFSHIAESGGIARLIDPRCTHKVSCAGTQRCSLERGHSGAHRMVGVLSSEGSGNG
jgi:hypothetical protein